MPVSSDSPPDLSAFVASTPRCVATATHCFGIHLHVVHTDAGPVQDVAWVSAQIEQAQRHFALIDTSFEIVAADALLAVDLEIDDRDERDALGHARFTRGVVHVFVVGRLADVDIAGNEIRGVHWRERGDRSHRWVILSKIAGSLVLPHELGHFFGLPHSTYDISLMNKSVRLTPLVSELTFAEPEVLRMRKHRDRMLGSGMLLARKP
ncbi:MAG: hypothetical protein H0T76_10320 [Nannocystis sp.]|nr:hypothetical protein [Nannocystis sp.]